jgi:hypothetical protein
MTLDPAAGGVEELHELTKATKDRELKQKLDEVLDEFRDLKQKASELEDRNRELREKLRFKSEEFEFRTPLVGDCPKGTPLQPGQVVSVPRWLWHKRNLYFSVKDRTLAAAQELAPLVFLQLLVPARPVGPAVCTPGIVTQYSKTLGAEVW